MECWLIVQPREAESKKAQNMSETALMRDVRQPVEIVQARSGIDSVERTVEAGSGV